MRHQFDKRIIAAAALLIAFQTMAQAVVIFQDTFSGGSPGDSYGLFRVGGDFSSWSLTSTLESESGNQHARYDFNTLSLPTSTWYGGYSERVSRLALPSEWQLSFDASLDVVGPILVTLKIIETKYPGTTMTFWVQPSDVGWQRVVIDQNTPYSLGPTLPIGVSSGIHLTVGLASHDANGNPLPTSQIGEHKFLLDNVTFESVPEPCAFSFLSLAGVLFFAVRRYRTTPF